MTHKTVEGKDITILICIKNELKNIQNNLTLWLNQKSHQTKCNVLIVDDCSDDKGIEYLNKFDHFSNLRVIKNTKNKEKGKINALFKGISAVNTQYVVLTDADCRPSSTIWASEMVQQLSEKTKIILGYSPYLPQSSIVNYFVQYETTLTATLYFGMALHGLPYMGVGRNLAYDTAFIQTIVQNYKHPKGLISGDDDMIINKYATAENTKVLLSPNAFCVSEAPQSIKQWLIQKNRHLSTGNFYKKRDKIILGLYAISHFVFLMSFFVLTFAQDFYVTTPLYIIRLLVLYLLFYKFLQFSSNPLNIFIVLLIDSLYFIYYLISSISIFFNLKINWK